MNCKSEGESPEADSRRLQWISRNCVISVLVMVVALIVAAVFNAQRNTYATESLKIGSASVSTDEGFHITYFRQNDNILEGSLGLDLDTADEPVLYEITDNEVSWQWKNGIQLHISEFFISSNIQCLKKVWIAVNYQDVLKDCYQLKEANWYGGGEFYGQSWPIQFRSRNETAFITGDMLQKKQEYYGGVVERFWFNSKGISLWVDETVPLFVSLNYETNDRLCLIGKNEPPYINSEFTPPILQYTVCTSESTITSYHQIFWKFFEIPKAIPHEALFQSPIWSTWAQFHSKINQELVLSFAKDIINNNLSRSILEIDDKWESCYGNLEFDMEKFPDPESMINTLHSLGFYVSLWVHPFSNYECSSYKEGDVNGFWVKNISGLTGETTWWNGKGGLLDVTNSSAVNWWIARLQRLKDDYGVDTFKFDAGEATWLPENFLLNAPVKLQPNIYSTKYAEVASHFGSLAEVRIGHRTQKHSLLVRILDRDSNWGEDNGLGTIIPTVLAFSVLGYPFVLPDMIGGNAYSSMPDKELFIRWVQLNIFLPSMQFSISPWQYDTEVINITKKAIEMHRNLSPLFIMLAKQIKETEAPIIRPIWWNWPEDVVTYTIDSQFMVGNVFLVAPVLKSKIGNRDIYLPKGIWKDELRNNLIEGPVWLLNYNVQLDEIPHFILLLKSS